MSETEIKTQAELEAERNEQVAQRRAKLMLVPSSRAPRGDPEN